jgi:hypothetical protein
MGDYCLSDDLANAWNSEANPFDGREHIVEIWSLAIVKLIISSVFAQASIASLICSSGTIYA